MTSHPEAYRGSPAVVVVVVVAIMLPLAIILLLSARGSDGAPAVPGSAVVADRGTAPPPGTELLPRVLSATDATLHEHDWFVLDGRAGMAHRIDSVGTLVLSFGRMGEGPGEFERPTAIVAHGDSIVVVDRDALHVFDPQGGHIADRLIAFEQCPAGRVQDAMSSPSGLIVMVRCREHDRIAWQVMAEGRDGFKRLLASRTRDAAIMDRSSLWLVLSWHPRGFLFGSPYDECLGLFDPVGRALDSVCHAWIARLPWPEEYRASTEGVRRRLRQSGIRLDLPTHLPPFIGVSSLSDGRIAYYAPLAGNDQALGLVTRGANGETVPIPVPRFPILFAEGNSILAARLELGGTRIAIKTLDRDQG